MARDPDALGDAERLLTEYPELSENGRDQLGQFLRRGAPIDIGLLSCDAALWKKADQFKAEHPYYFSVGRRIYGAWAAVVIAITAVLVLIKDAGAN